MEKRENVKEAGGIHERSSVSLNLKVVSFTTHECCDLLHIRLPVDFSVYMSSDVPKHAITKCDLFSDCDRDYVSDNTMDCFMTCVILKRMDHKQDTYKELWLE
jgi:hypothetical protein